MDRELEPASRFAKGWAVDEFLLAHAGWALRISALLILAAIGILDYKTGWSVSLALFYSILIFVVAIYESKRTSLVLCLLSTFVWWLVNERAHPYQSEWNFLWNTLSRGCQFLFFVIGGLSFQTYRQANRERISALERAAELEQEIVRVGEREQCRIAQDLHDGICQQMAGIGMAASSLARDLQRSAHPSAADAAEIEALIKDVVNETRDLAHGISPFVVESCGLPGALETLAFQSSRSSSPVVHFKHSGDELSCDPGMAMHLYRIAQEALNNAMKHAGAKSIIISLLLEEKSGMLRLAIEDDGRGMVTPQGRSSPSMGLKTMRYRAGLISGVLDISPRVGGGTVVSCQVPLTATVK